MEYVYGVNFGAFPLSANVAGCNVRSAINDVISLVRVKPACRVSEL